MTINSQWFDPEQSILHIVYEPGWTWRDMHSHDQKTVLPLLRTSRHQIALMVDLRKAQMLPPRDFTLNIKQAIHNYRDAQVDVVVFVTKDREISHLLETSYRHFADDQRIYTHANCPDEAAENIYMARTQIYA